MGRLLGVTLGVLAWLAVAAPGAAEAQGIAVGPRFSLVRGDLATNTPTTRFIGGTVRLSASKLLGFEGSLDLRTTWDPARTQRLRETPLQGSILIYPFRTMIAPYALGGLGIYTRTLDAVGTGGVITRTAQERKTGMHLGFGGELRMARHVVAYVDYRYRFVKFGNDPTASGGGLINLLPGVNNLKLSHEGSMWTGGVAFVF